MEIDISIVSGTYNRMHWLTKMVESVRRSMHGYHGLSYEIVLVDGGSQDGTQNWCQSQPDIRLIQHEKLLGAVKAFNDGAYAARGQYVILANDDIEFLGDTIPRAWAYMQKHPDCGVGCFFQDRNRQDWTDEGGKWHVETMPVVRNGSQAAEPYGQVCIVPKWLGDDVGWWCNSDDYTSRGLKPLHVYGGDNELSSNVYHVGYKVSPIPETKIHDNEAKDDLRKINNITGGKDPRSVRGHHPDSWNWGKRWRNESKNLVGAVIKNEPIIFPPQPLRHKERVLYLPIYETGWAVQKEQKRGLREALARVAAVVEYDYVARYQEIGQARMIGELETICHALYPTIILTQLHNGEQIGPSDIGKLRANAPGARMINWNGDYWPENLLSEDGITLARAFDLQTTVNREVDEKYREIGVNSQYWQIGWEPDGRGHAPDVYHDVVFLGSGYSQKRQEFVSWAKSVPNINFGLYGNGWPNGWASGQNLYDFKAGCGIYRGAKISLGDSQWPESGFVSNRVMQALAAGGAALAHQWFRGMEHLGLVDGETCIIWRTLPELKEKIIYYLAHEDERRRIATAGEALAVDRHSFDMRVAELFDMLGIGAEIQADNWDSWRW